MAKPYTLEIQKILKNSNHIEYLSETNIRFTKEVKMYLVENCNSILEIKKYLISLGVEVNLINNVVFRNLHTSYSSEVSKFKRGAMSKKNLHQMKSTDLKK